LEKNMAARLLANLVISGGAHGGSFQVPIGATQSFQVPIGAPVSACWYAPIDDIPSLMAWDHIEVTPSTPGNVTLILRPNRDNLLRIYVYGE
jgi:hypothetical protein